jgi:hypothetical protein
LAGRSPAAFLQGCLLYQNLAGLAAGKTYKFSGWTNIPATTDSFTFQLEVR